MTLAQAEHETQRTAHSAALAAEVSDRKTVVEPHELARIAEEEAVQGGMARGSQCKVHCQVRFTLLHGVDDSGVGSRQTNSSLIRAL